MKAMMGVLVLLLAAANGFAQASKPAAAVSEKQWESLQQALANEDWVKAADEAAKYLKQATQEDNEHSLARLRHMFMFASAAKVAEGKMSYDDLKVTLKDLVGKEVMTSYTTLTATCLGVFNSICVKTSGDYDLSLASSNKSATYIYMFQYVRLTAKPDSIKDKKLGAIIGSLETIQFNPNQSNIWIMRVFIEKATLVFGE